MKSMRLVLTILMSALLLVSSPLFGMGTEEDQSRWETIEAEGTITVATSGTLFPASYYSDDNQTLTGFDVEVMRAIADQLGLAVNFEIMAFDAMLSAIRAGRVDAAVNDINKTAEREELFDFAGPYKYSWATLMVRSEDLSGIQTLDDLAGKVHAGEATTTFSRIMRSYGAEILTYDNATNDQYLRDLELGRSDVIMNDYFLQSLALEYMPEFEVQLHPDFKFWIQPNGTFVVMPKGASELQKQIESAIGELRADGTLGAISNEFFGQDVTSRPDDLEAAGYTVIAIDQLPE